MPARRSSTQQRQSRRLLAIARRRLVLGRPLPARRPVIHGTSVRTWIALWRSAWCRRCYRELFGISGGIAPASLARMSKLTSRSRRDYCGAVTALFNDLRSWLRDRNADRRGQSQKGRQHGNGGAAHPPHDKDAQAAAAAELRQDAADERMRSVRRERARSHC